MNQPRLVLRAMQPITNLTPREIATLLADWEETSGRAKALVKHLYRHQEQSFAKMSGIRAQLRKRLQEEFFLPRLEIRAKQESQDGTLKFLFVLPDGERIETVLIPDVGKKAGKRALCVSTQVGCALGCAFCLTGVSGLKRNLETWEIVEQYREVSRHLKEPITHLVFMGMGEPLHNFSNLLRSIAIFTAKDGANIPERKITVSTSGLTPQFKALAEKSNVLLALSLHAANDPLREGIMPINKKYGIAELLQVVRALPPKKQARIFIEYILLAGVNDREEDALELSQLLDKLPCKVNLIPYNEISVFSFRRPNENKIFSFLTALKKAGLSVSIRRSRGSDIYAACGQLSNQPISLAT